MRKFVLLLSSFLFYIIPVNIANGCGFSLMEYSYRVFLFQPDVTNNVELSPFFYTSDFLYYDGVYNCNEPAYQQNCKEWQAQTNYKGNVKDIYAALYQTDLGAVIYHEDSLVKANKFISHLKKKCKAEYEYYVYAKKCEVVINNEDPWRLGQYSQSDTLIVNQCLKEGQAIAKKTKNDFVKLRVNYQLIKLNFYHPGFGDDGLDIYKKQIEKSPISSWIKESARFYVLEKMSSGADEYQYELTKSFDKSIDKRFRCVQLFDRKNYRKYLMYAQNNHEKANIYVMSELQHPGRSLDVLKKIYELDPTNKDLALLLSREINKMEDLILTPQLTEQSPALDYWSNWYNQVDVKRRKSDMDYLNSLYQFIVKIILDKKQSNENVFRLIASHICLLNNSKDQALDHLNSCNLNRCNEKEKLQIMANRLLLKFDGKTKMNTDLEKQILEFVDYESKHTGQFIHQRDFVNQVYLYIGKQLIEADDIAKGICMLSNTNKVIGTISYWTVKDYYIVMLEKAQPKDYDEVIALIQKKKKTEFEKFLIDRRVDRSNIWEEDYYEYADTIPISVNKMLDYKSMYYVQNGMLDKALECVTKIDPAYFKEYPYNLFKCFPFTVPGSLDYQSNNDFYVYNKRMYLQRMCDLQKLIDNNIGDQARNHFVLATGYFNMGYHGNYWIMNMPYKLSDEVTSDYSSINLSNKEFCNNYYGCQTAEKHYLEAMRLTTDSVFGALCAARASACNIHFQELNWRRTATYNESKYDWNEEFNAKYGIYKKQYEKQFSTKGYYDEFVSNCYFYEHVASRYY